VIALYRTTTTKEEKHMSSFTIDKKEYVKVAGYIAGIAKGCSTGVHEFWLWDSKEHKNTDKDLFYKRFVQCYEMNAESVKKQYRGDEVGAPSNDQNDYKAEFNQCYEKGKCLLFEDTNTINQAIADIQNFLSSSLYQTEDDKYNFMMKHWYDSIIDQLVEKVLLGSYESKCWGDFNPPETNRNITRIA
jgi:hypothetical protein